MTTEIEQRNDEFENDEYRDIDPQSDVEQELYEPYKCVSKAAALSLVMALLAFIGLISPALLSLAALAVALGVMGRRNVLRYPNELSGRRLALAGLILGLFLLVGGAALHSYVYMTEVPEGYQRISFEDLQPGDGDLRTGAPRLPTELDGKRVFVKGYVHPGVSDMGEIRKFILVPDMGTCCFGGQPEMTDMIEVTITGQRGVRYAPRKRKLGGLFHVHHRVKKVAGGLQGGLYELQADYVK